MTMEKLREWADEFDAPSGEWEYGYDAARHHVRKLLDKVSPVVQVAHYNVEEAVPEGWELYTVERSVRASGGSGLVHVMLVRNPEQKAKWLLLPDDRQAVVDLYVSGVGWSVANAVAFAAQSAREAGLL